MTESFVDISYRGLSLGRRIKLTQIRPSSGYLEHPMPMPVGTKVAVTTDEGVTFEAIVTHVHEQVGGSEKAPGMTVKPSEPIAWWTDRVTLPEAEPPRAPERARSITVRPRSHTTPMPIPPEGALIAQQQQPAPPIVAEPPPPPATAAIDPPTDRTPVVDDKKTAIMNAVDQELLEQLTRDAGDIDAIVRTTGEHEIVDDGQRTMAMQAVDPTALGIDVTASGSIPVVDDDEGDEESEPVSVGNGNGTATNGDKKPRGKRRKKKR